MPRRVTPAPGGNYCEKTWKPANPHWPSLLRTVSLPRSIHAPRRPRQPILPRRRDRCVPARSTSAGVLRRTAAGEFYCRRGRRRQEIRVRPRLRGAAGAASITMPPSASPHTASCWPSGPRFPLGTRIRLAGQNACPSRRSPTPRHRRSDQSATSRIRSRPCADASPTPPHRPHSDVHAVHGRSRTGKITREFYDAVELKGGNRNDSGSSQTSMP